MPSQFINWGDGTFDFSAIKHSDITDGTSNTILGALHRPDGVDIDLHRFDFFNDGTFEFSAITVPPVDLDLLGVVHPGGVNAGMGDGSVRIIVGAGQGAGPHIRQVVGDWNGDGKDDIGIVGNADDDLLIAGTAHTYDGGLFL